MEIQELFQKDMHNSEKFTPRTAIFISKNNFHDVKNPMLHSIISNNDDEKKIMIKIFIIIFLRILIIVLFLLIMII